MATTGQMLRKFQALNLGLLAAQVLEDTERELVTFNQNQLFRGEGADGNKLPKYKSAKYAKAKNENNPVPGLGTPDYRLTGRMYQAMYIDFKGDNLTFQSPVDYFGYLTSRGGDPMGLSPESKKEYIRVYFNSRFVRLIAQKTGVEVT